MKRIKKFVKILTISFAIIITCTLIFSAGFFLVTTNGVSLNTDKLDQISGASTLKIYDTNKKIIAPTTKNYISITKLASHTKNAFIAAEDKRYYKHNGIDYIRIGGALVSNIKTRSFSEGASTISQQLIKNTQLTSEKTIKRKLREIKLTKALERNYSKNQILEMYLNNIYFGNGCYGIENASNHYFNKSASKLTIAESALLAGTINAPSLYDIENNIQKAITRRNLILNSMKKQNKINETDYNNAINEKPNLNLTKISNNNYLYSEIIKEACNKLNTTENNIVNNKYKIYTNTNLNINKEINNILTNKYKNLQKYANIGVIIIQNKTNNIIFTYGNKSILTTKKQPGSTIKPILVYAPAIEKNIITPSTKILDEKINISGYSPENADKKFHGFVTVREALKNSYNIPSVKLLNELGIKNAQNFAKKLDIEFSDKDNNLAIALGGFTKGVTLKSLADAYTSFANSGEFSTSSFITKIENENGKILYIKDDNKKQVMRKSTAYLITDILKDCSKSGTAKRLMDFDFDIASKTGTVGENNSQLNSDAFNISYTTEHTIISYIGGNNLNESINGATYPTMITKDILNILYKTHKPKNFKTPTSIIKTENNINETKTINSKNNLDENYSTLKINIINNQNSAPIISFYATQNYNYKLIRKNKTKEEIILSLVNINENKIMNYEDKNAKSNQIYEYFIEVYDNNNNFLQKSNSIKLKIY